MEIKFPRTAGTHFLAKKRNIQILKQLKVESGDEKPRRQINLATTCNKNAQQLGAKNNAEL
jgi:hypothetical protein